MIPIRWSLTALAVWIVLYLLDVFPWWVYAAAATVFVVDSWIHLGRQLHEPRS